jgi:3-hydroxyisobutyrate dehydrogenase-like beta-hydroxyacid dehydrogenase
MHKKIGILGYGEVGQSLYRVYQDTGSTRIFVRDLERDDGFQDLDVLNVCIPYSVAFVSVVKKNVQESNAKLVIIHSTVPPGTTAQLSEMRWDHDIHIVHSPVRGIHPYLYKSLKKFIKFVGAESYEAAEHTLDHLGDLGIPAEFVGSTLNSELGKLLSTTYYGVCIAWHGEMYKICKKLGANFDQAVTRFNETYNEGYTLLGKENVVRPVLTPPRGKNAHIGGHCIVSNAELLKPLLDSKALELVIEYKNQEGNKP